MKANNQAGPRAGTGPFVRHAAAIAVLMTIAALLLHPSTGSGDETMVPMSAEASTAVEPLSLPEVRWDRVQPDDAAVGMAIAAYER